MAMTVDMVVDKQMTSLTKQRWFEIKKDFITNSKSQFPDGVDDTLQPFDKVCWSVIIDNKHLFKPYLIEKKKIFSHLFGELMKNLKSKYQNFDANHVKNEFYKSLEGK